MPFTWSNTMNVISLFAVGAQFKRTVFILHKLPETIFAESCIFLMIRLVFF